jgi:hypothetical protein
MLKSFALLVLAVLVVIVLVVSFNALLFGSFLTKLASL